jgi:cellulose biosynthesis protein BcsQ
MKPQIITFASWKGGTGKSTIQTAVIHLLADMNKKIGIIDLDSNLTTSTIFDVNEHNFSSFNLLSGTAGVFHKINENIHIIPSIMEISKLSNLSEKELKYILSKMDLTNYDFIFIDPPGTMNALTRNAICASDKIIIPAQPSSIDFRAVSLIFNEMEKMSIEADINIVVNASDPKINEPGIFDKYENTYSDFLYPEYITNMLSLKKLTANFHNYKLQGLAKNKIERFVSQVIL